MFWAAWWCSGLPHNKKVLGFIPCQKAKGLCAVHVLPMSFGLLPQSKDMHSRSMCPACDTLETFAECFAAFYPVTAGIGSFDPGYGCIIFHLMTALLE